MREVAAKTVFIVGRNADEGARRHTVDQMNAPEQCTPRKIASPVVAEFIEQEVVKWTV